MPTAIFPTYKRKEQLNVKLTLEQVASLRADYKSGRFSKGQLGEKYGVSRATISYWLQTDEERAEANKKRSTRKRTYNPEAHRRYLDRKKEHDKEGVLAYRREVNRKSRAKNIETIRERDRLYRRERRAKEREERNNGNI